MKRRTAVLLFSAASLCAAISPLAHSQNSGRIEITEEFGDIEVTLDKELEGEVRGPTVYSADGRMLLYLQKAVDIGPEGEDGYAYTLAEADGANPRVIYRTLFKDDLLYSILFGSQAFSQDGKNVAVLKAQDADFRKHLLGVYHLADGTLTTLECENGECWGASWAESGLVYLDGDLRSDKGYSVKSWNGKATEVLFRSEKGFALGLRTPPNGLKAAFFNIKDPTVAQLRVLDLKTKEIVDSQEFFPARDVPMGDLPYFLWDIEGKGIYYSQGKDDDGGKITSHLMYFDVASKESRRITDENRMVPFCVLDKNHLVVWHNDGEDHWSVFRFSDRKLFDFVLMHGRLGPRVVIGRHGREARTKCGRINFPIR